MMLDTCMQLMAMYMEATPITDIALQPAACSLHRHFATLTTNTALQPALTLPSDCSLGSCAMQCQCVFWQDLMDAAQHCP